MPAKTSKQFGIWMDNRRATIVGIDPEAGAFSVIGHVTNPGAPGNSNENAANNHQITLTHKFFREIAIHLVNADEIHLTGTGTIQEQFQRWLAGEPQFKKTVTTESTSNPMSDERVVAFITSRFSQEAGGVPTAP